MSTGRYRIYGLYSGTPESFWSDNKAATVNTDTGHTLTDTVCAMDRMQAMAGDPGGGSIGDVLTLTATTPSRVISLSTPSAPAPTSYRTPITDEIHAWFFRETDAAAFACVDEIRTNAIDVPYVVVGEQNPVPKWRESPNAICKGAMPKWEDWNTSVQVWRGAIIGGLNITGPVTIDCIWDPGVSSIYSLTGQLFWFDCAQMQWGGVKAKLYQGGDGFSLECASIGQVIIGGSQCPLVGVHHIGFVIDTNRVETWFDGEVYNRRIGIDPSLVPVITGVRIGTNNNADYPVGQFREFRMWNSAKSADFMRSRYHDARRI